MALGVTMQLPEADRYSHTRDYLEGQIAIMMGGRIAEEVFLNHMTTALRRHLRRQPNLHARWFASLECPSLGPITYGKKEEQIFLGREIAQHQDYSEDTAIKIDQEVNRLITEQYNRARQIIIENKDALVRLAEALLERESLDSIQIRRLVAGLPLDDGRADSYTYRQAQGGNKAFGAEIQSSRPYQAMPVRKGADEQQRLLFLLLVCFISDSS
jgi:cell division protease FtsH